MCGFVVLVACGASPRMVHQSNTYFEHCHAADLDPGRTMDERKACWSAWLDHYGEPQPPERRAYASARIEAIERGEAIRPLPDVTTYRAAFLGSDGEQVEVASDDPQQVPRDVEPAPAISSDPCINVCTPRLTACLATCGARGADCVTACRAEHNVCLRGCY